MKIVQSLMFFINIMYVTSQEAPALLVQVSFDLDTLEQIAPLSFLVSIKNQSDSIMPIFPLDAYNGRYLFAGKMVLEVKKERDPSWAETNCIIVNPSSNNRYSSVLPLFSNALVPGEERLSKAFICATPSQMQAPGNFLLRVLYTDRYGTAYYSRPKSVFVKSYEGEDQLAFTYLKERINPIAILTPFNFSEELDTSILLHAKNTSELYPTTRVSDYAEASLCYIYALKAQYVAYNSFDKALGIHYLKLSKKYGLLVNTNNDSSLSDKVGETLKTLTGILYHLYNGPPSRELELEFRYPYKN